LLLRVLVAVSLIAHSVTHIGTAKLRLVDWLIMIVVLAVASCLLVGFMTPVVSVAIGIGAIASAAAGLDTIQALINLIVLAITVALLGPGAFSIDARKFGRREILIPNTTRSSKS
jgi:uncharacterized membrane protein YphA (DoxX/SURF4 family)